MAAEVGVVELVEPVGELTVGVVEHPEFDSVVTLGAGGVLAELVAEAAWRVAPLDRLEVESMLDEPPVVAALARGSRCSPGGDLGLLVDAVTAGSALASAAGSRVRELEINPRFVLPEGEGVVAGGAVTVLA